MKKKDLTLIEILEIIALPNVLKMFNEFMKGNKLT